MRGLLCVPQSSKERLRRSRTESSGAAPAIEELAGEARQVRPAGPHADKYQPGSDFSRAKRSGGRQALQLPRTSYSRGSLNIHLCPDRVQQKSEVPSAAPSPPPRKDQEGVRLSSFLEHHSLAVIRISAPDPRHANSIPRICLRSTCKRGKYELYLCLKSTGSEIFHAAAISGVVAAGRFNNSIERLCN